MGFDQKKLKSQYETFIKIVSPPYMVIGYAGNGLYELVIKLNTRASEARESAELKAFRQKVSQVLSNL